VRGRCCGVVLGDGVLLCLVVVLWLVVILWLRVVLWLRIVLWLWIVLIVLWLWWRIVLGLRLVLWLRGHGCGCYGQMGAAGPEAILARSVRDGPPLAARVHIAVRSLSVTVHVGLFFELYTVFLRVGGPKRAISRQVALFTQNGGSLRVITVLRR